MMLKNTSFHFTSTFLQLFIPNSLRLDSSIIIGNDVEKHFISFHQHFSSVLRAKTSFFWPKKAKIALGCASTGLAAQVYGPGEFMTAHTLFKIPVVEDSEDYEDLVKQKKQRVFTR